MGESTPKSASATYTTDTSDNATYQVWKDGELVPLFSEEDDPLLVSKYKKRHNPPKSDPRAWSGKVYPDGSFTIGAIPPERKDKAEKVFDDCWQDSQFENVPADIGGQDGRNRSKKYADYVTYGADPRSPSGLDRRSELSQEKKRYGLNGLTSYGKRMVKSGSALMERRYGKDRLALLTSTLASEKHGLDAVELYHLARNWNQVVRQFCQELTRELERQNAPTEVIMVSEIQEGRFRKYGEVAPHLHLVFVAKSAGRKWHWYLSPKWLTDLWNRVISNILGEESEFKGSGGSVDVKRVRKSVTRYISKYMSKGGKLLAEIADKSLSECLPSQWWGAYGGLRDSIKKNTCSLTQQAIKKIQQGIGGGDSWIKWSRQIEIDMGEGGLRVVGLAGGLTTQAYEFFAGIPWNEPVWE